MKLLFLRGQVPSDRPASQITFNNLSDCDDMWTQLAYALLDKNDNGEIWYEKGNRVTRYTYNFVERWVSRYRDVSADFKPDIVFARGGFPFQLAEAERHSSAFKVYYGAGERVVPKRGQCWDLVLTDTLKQRDTARQRGYRADMFIKPAADNIFRPTTNITKPEFDVIYAANWNANANKGHRYLLPALSNFSVISLGRFRKGWVGKYPNVSFRGWQPRKVLPHSYALAKVAVIYTVGKDSCPRVIPEALACNCPILVGSSTKLWFDRYVTPETGLMFSKTNFVDKLNELLASYKSYTPRQYYENNLSIPCAAKHLLALMNAD